MLTVDSELAATDNRLIKIKIKYYQLTSDPPAAPVVAVLFYSVLLLIGFKKKGDKSIQTETRPGSKKPSYLCVTKSPLYGDLITQPPRPAVFTTPGCCGYHDS